MPPKLLVIDPSVVFPEEEGTKVVLGDWPHDVSIIRPALDGSALTTEVLSGCTGIILMGSAASVHDPLPWLKDLSSLLMPVLNGELHLALLGICFGHQLIAHLTGAPVGFVHEDHHKESGFRTTHFCGSKLIADDNHISVVASHKEQLLRMPSGYRATAEREHVPFDAIEHLTLPIFGVQFHPEARRDFTSRRNMEPDRLDAQYTGPMDELLAGFRRIAI